MVPAGEVQRRDVTKATARRIGSGGTLLETPCQASKGYPGLGTAYRSWTKAVP
jgi:hypothetical protein